MTTPPDTRGLTAQDYCTASGLPLAECAEHDHFPWDVIRSGPWLEQQHFPPLQYAVDGLISEGYGLLAGPPKVRKSWLALSVLMAVAQGVPALGGAETGRARPVLYLALEDGDRRMRRRMKAVLGPRSFPSNFHYVTALTSDQAFATLHGWFDRHGSNDTLVVLDTLGKIMPPKLAGETVYERDYRVGSQLKSIVDAHPGCTLLVVHHTRKQASEDFMEDVGGTNGINGAADFTLVLKRARTSNRGTLQVTGRDIFEGEYALDWADQGCQWTLVGGDLRAASEALEEQEQRDGLGDLSQEVLAAVNDAPDGITPKTLAAVVQGFNGDNDMASTYLGRLEKNGRIRKTGRGKYAPIPTAEVFDPFEVFEGDGSSPTHSNTSDTSNTPPRVTAA